MTKRSRQYIGLIAAIVAYYVIHEGAHLVYAVATGVFKGIRFMGMGMQIDVHAEQMTESQLGIFCAVGAISTLIFAYVLIALIGRISKVQSNLFWACAYYVTIAMLLIDPLYLSLLCGFFGGGDMNGIALLVPEIAVRIAFFCILIGNAVVFVKIVLPKYQRMFRDCAIEEIRKET